MTQPGGRINRFLDSRGSSPVWLGGLTGQFESGVRSQEVLKSHGLSQVGSGHESGQEVLRDGSGQESGGFEVSRVESGCVG